jgi:hypothetical protein
MANTESITHEALTAALRRVGFAFLGADSIRRLMHVDVGNDWQAFASSWNDLPLDTYLLARGCHRRRRHAVFSISTVGSIVREAHQPHYQSAAYNALQGGIERWFEPIQISAGDGSILWRILKFCAVTFGTLAPDVRSWRSEAHQFRIEASRDQEGQPTPEGVHRDGVDYVLVLLIDRRNIVSGTTTIHTANGDQLGSFTLTNPLDAALVDDERVFHGVTPVHPEDPSKPAHRDVLVVTLTRQVV